MKEREAEVEGTGAAWRSAACRWLGPLTIAQSAALRLGGQIAGRAILLAMIVLIARRLGVQDFGRYAFISAYLAFLRLLGGLGLPAVLLKEFTRPEGERLPQLAAVSLSLTVSLTLLAMVCACVTIVLLPGSLDLRLDVLIASLSLVSLLGNTHLAWFQAQRRLHIVTLAELAQAAVTALFTMAFLLSGGGLRAALWALVAGSVAPLLVYGAIGRGAVPLAFCWERAVMLRLLGMALPLAIVSAFSVILLRLDVVMLHAMRSDLEVAWYSAAIKLTEPWLLVATSLTAALFPELCVWYRAAPAAFSRCARLTYKYLLACILPVAAGGTLVARPVVALVFGPRYAPAGPAFAILLWALVFFFLESFTTYLLLAANKPWWDTAFTVCAAVLNVALNLVLIPRFGFTGAAVSSLVAYASYWLLQVLCPATRIFAFWLLEGAPRALVATLVMGFVVAVPLHRQLAPSLLVAPILYVAVYVASRGVERRDLDLFLRPARFLASALDAGDASRA